jgi:hypothetical protein
MMPAYSKSPESWFRGRLSDFLMVPLQSTWNWQAESQLKTLKIMKNQIVS